MLTISCLSHYKFQHLGGLMLLHLYFTWKVQTSMLVEASLAL